MLGHRSTRTAALAISIAATATMTGCSGPAEDTSPPAPEESSGVEAPASYDVRAELRDVVSEVEKEFNVRAGVAVADREGTVNAGLRGEEPAWSTVKVPIAIAALRDGASPELVDLAIKESDNDAA